MSPGIYFVPGCERPGTIADLYDACGLDKRGLNTVEAWSGVIVFCSSNFHA